MRANFSLRFVAYRAMFPAIRMQVLTSFFGGSMSTSKLAEQVAEKIKSLPSDKQQEILKSLESFVAEATREMPRKYTGAAWAKAVAIDDGDEHRPNVWRFTAGPRPSAFE